MPGQQPAFSTGGRSDLAHLAHVADLTRRARAETDLSLSKPGAVRKAARGVWIAMENPHVQ